MPSIYSQFIEQEQNVNIKASPTGDDILLTAIPQMRRRSIFAVNRQPQQHLRTGGQGRVESTLALRQTNAGKIKAPGKDFSWNAEQALQSLLY